MGKLADQAITPVVSPGYDIAQGRSEPIEETRLQQKFSDLSRLALDDLADEIVDDVAVIASEGCDELCWIGYILQGEARHLQACCPTLSTPFQGRDVLGRQVEAHGAIKE
ncbi:MAG: hypothetical protein P8124_07450, partial [Gammaproteobacteria bacterium]